MDGELDILHFSQPCCTIRCQEDGQNECYEGYCPLLFV